MIKKVWFNINTGEFSNSWNVDTHNAVGFKIEDLIQAKKDGFKLISYECINDGDFEFCDLMKVISNNP